MVGCFFLLLLRVLLLGVPVRRRRKEWAETRFPRSPFSEQEGRTGDDRDGQRSVIRK